jgi:hypothetical protein
MPTLQHKSETYEEFVEKFQPKKTTDDCMTPPAVYDIIADWVTARYGVARSDMVRPFWPGADFEAFEYNGRVVVDNPPFSIEGKILKYYNEHGIKYFLFAPMLTCFGHLDKCEAVLIKPAIVYDNGATVRTAFLTNLPTDYKVEYSDYLSEALKPPTKAMPTTQKPDNWWIASECISQKRSIQKSEYLGKRTKTPEGKKIYGGAAETIVSRL